MKILEALQRDFDVDRPRVVLLDDLVILEHVTSLLSVSEEQVVVGHGKHWVTSVYGKNFVVKELDEGRILLEGTIQRTEFWKS